MANILAFDWDEREARVVVATTRGENARVRAAVTIALEPVADSEAEDETTDEGADGATEETSDGASGGASGGATGGAAEETKKDAEPAPAESVGPDPRLGARLKDIFKKYGAGRGPVLVGVDRGSVELLHSTLPPAGDEELAELVHNQIARELHVSSEDGVIDFVPMSRDPNEPRAVTAALLPTAQLERLRATCDAANVKPTRFLLRAYAAASLFSRTASPPEDVCLLANRIGDEVDLTVLDRGEAVFSRTIRLPRDLSESILIERLTAEIRRTIAVSLQNTPEDGPVEGVYLFGGPNEYQHVIERIQEELGVAAMVIDPFVAVDNAEQVPPQNAGEFAPLLGMILDEARDRAHAIDFLNPRRLPKPPNRNRLYAGIAAAVVLVLGSGGFYAWDQISQAKEENAQVYRRMRDIEKSVKAGKKKERMVAAIEDWRATDVCWLDELRDLALRLPSSRDIVLHRMTLSPGRSGGGSVNYSGQVRDPDIILRMGNAIRDRFHDIESPRVQERGDDKEYTWRFTTSMSVARRAPSQYTSHLPKPPEAPERVDAKADAKVAKGDASSKKRKADSVADAKAKQPSEAEGQKRPTAEAQKRPKAGEPAPRVKAASMGPGLASGGAKSAGSDSRPKKKTSTGPSKKSSRNKKSASGEKSTKAKPDPSAAAKAEKRTEGRQ